MSRFLEQIGSDRPAKTIVGLQLGLLLGLGFLLALLHGVVGDLVWELRRSKVLHSVLGATDLGTLLPIQVIAFSAALLGLHLLLGGLAWALALASEPSPAATIRRRRIWTVAWFLAMALWVLATNQAWFPSSDFHRDSWRWIAAEWNGLSAYRLYSAALGSGMAFAAISAATRILRHRARGVLRLAATATTAGVLTLAWTGLSPRDSEAHVSANAPPNVIIIGIDSMRCDLARGEAESSLTPAVDRFLASAHRFADATTPLARTYPAWVSILTGRHPANTNARFNLVPRDIVDTGDTIGDALRARGYSSVYATDEVRFANIDETFGFDRLITPRIGASDFLLAKVNDLPLSNLMASTRVGAWLFPNTHANRAAHVTYQPKDFVNRIERELPSRKPIFLVTHLTLAHYPYAWAGHAKPTTPEGYRTTYRNAIAEVDRQFDQVMQVLEHKGLLDNAYVVLLSDHGEALGFPDDSLLRGYSDKGMLWDSLWGHGTSVLSPHQFQVLLAVRGYGRAALGSTPGTHQQPVSLEDLRPTLLELVGASPGQDLDGRSFRSALTGVPPFAAAEGRLRFTETGFNTPKVLKGQYDESGLLQEGARYYELDAASARVQLRADRMAELLATKERAVIGDEYLLAALPAADTGRTQFILARRDGRLAARLDQAPDPATHPEGARLWRALHEHFKGEI